MRTSKDRLISYYMRVSQSSCAVHYLMSSTQSSPETLAVMARRCCSRSGESKSALELLKCDIVHGFSGRGFFRRLAWIRCREIESVSTLHPEAEQFTLWRSTCIGFHYH